MGYTTEFTGRIKLSRKLTLGEARELLVLNDDSDKAEAATGIRGYFQWVPSEALDEIVWDGNEKFYDWDDYMRWLCGTWLLGRGIEANGELFWSGESADDVGVLRVVANEVSTSKGPSGLAGSEPLTLDRLGELALDMVTQA